MPGRWAQQVNEIFTLGKASEGWRIPRRFRAEKRACLPLGFGLRRPSAALENYKIRRTKIFFQVKTPCACLQTAPDERMSARRPTSLASRLLPAFVEKRHRLFDGNNPLLLQQIGFFCGEDDLGTQTAFKPIAYRSVPQNSTLAPLTAGGAIGSIIFSETTIEMPRCGVAIR